MTPRWSRWGAASGVITCLLWAPIGLLVPQLPDLGSAAAIERFYRNHQELLKVVILLISCGFFFLLCFLGALVERLRHAEGSGPLAWIALGSGLLFMTSLNIAVGLVGGIAAPILAWILWILLASLWSMRHAHRHDDTTDRRHFPGCPPHP
jgi:hypothetical protein